MTVPIFRAVTTDPTERGRSFGRSARESIHNGFSNYTELFNAFGVRSAQVKEWGERALAETAAWAPEIAAEIHGMAEGAEMRPWQLGALNGRTEILAAATTTGEGECSTSVMLPRTGFAPRTIQTWDWHHVLNGGMLVLTLEPRSGHRVHTFTEFGMVGKIGVNSAGIGVHFNVLRHCSDNAEIGVPVHVVARRILDEATTVDEAVRIAASARLSASSLITVSGFDGTNGQVRGLELCPDGVAVLDADESGMFLHTNHFLDATLSRGERTVAKESSTGERLTLLREHAAELAEENLTRRAQALRSHRSDGAPVCAHADLALPQHMRWQTLATIALDLATCRLAVHEGGPCTVESGSWQWSPSNQEAGEAA